MRTRNSTTNRKEQGYSLVEILIAIAILGTVLLSIMTLFVFGRRNVYSGRQMTRATSVATHVMEDLMPITPTALYTTFGITSTTAVTASTTVAGVTYTDAILRKQSDFASGSAGRRYFDNWMNLLPQNRIQSGDITLIIMPRDLATAGNVTTARRIIVRAVTEWAEDAGGATGGRRRQVALDITKLNTRF
jgi:prepilin-type N-terminal cleavage/methylation domain-containing protein